MKTKTPSEVIKVLEHEISEWFCCPTAQARHRVACMERAIAIVRLWHAGITPADVRAAERKRKRKGRAK